MLRPTPVKADDIVLVSAQDCCPPLDAPATGRRLGRGHGSGALATGRSPRTGSRVGCACDGPFAADRVTGRVRL